MKHVKIVALLSLIGSSIFSMESGESHSTFNKRNMNARRKEVRPEPRPVIDLSKSDAENLKEIKQSLRSQGTVSLKLQEKKIDRSSYKELIKQDCIHLMGGCVVFLAIVCYYVYELYAQNAEGLA